MPSVKKLLGAFTDAIDAAGADRKLVGVLHKVREEVIPDLEALLQETDRGLDRVLGIRDKIRAMRADVDAEIVEEKE